MTEYASGYLGSDEQYLQQKDYNSQKHSLEVDRHALRPDIEWDVQHYRGKQSNPKPDIFAGQAFPFVLRTNPAPILARYVNDKTTR